MKSTKGCDLAVLLLGLAALTACSDHNPETATAAPTPTPTVSASTTKAETENSLTVSGPLVVEHQLDLLAQRDGVIAKLLSDVGARVKTGDVLAQLDDRQISADLQAARSKASATEAELKSWQSEERVLQSDFARAKKLWDAQLIPLEQFEHTKYKAEEEHYEAQKVE